MNTLNNLIRYICAVYPHSHELSNARLTKLIYLADWESIKATGNQVTDIYWYFDNYGPFVHNVYEVANEDPEIEIVKTQTIYGTPKVMFRYEGDIPDIDSNLKKILDSVIENTKNLYWNDFIKYVYSTPPIEGSNRYTFLKLNDFVGQSCKYSTLNTTSSQNN